jgi:hypothetical protein
VSSVLQLWTGDITVWGVAFQNWMPFAVVLFVISLTALKEKLMMAVTGAGLIVGTTLVFWQLLPHNGREHPFVRNSGIGSMVTIGLLTTLTFGVALLWSGLSG